MLRIIQKYRALASLNHLLAEGVRILHPYYSKFCPTHGFQLSKWTLCCSTYEMVYLSALGVSNLISLVALLLTTSNTTSTSTFKKLRRPNSPASVIWSIDSRVNLNL